MAEELLLEGVDFGAEGGLALRQGRPALLLQVRNVAFFELHLRKRPVRKALLPGSFGGFGALLRHLHRVALDSVMRPFYTALLPGPLTGFFARLFKRCSFT